jgi:HAD superfamily hydrolase (TIGR01509 family)
MTAVLFGSIGTVADTSELQREAFNRAFEHHDLDWHWDRDEYLSMLETSGGEERIAARARSLGQTVDAGAVHRTKSKIFQDTLATSGIVPRPGVVETIRAAKGRGLTVGLVTTTSRANITAMLEALAPDVAASDFAVITDITTVGDPKPDPAVYTHVLEALGEQARTCVAIEDNLGGVEAARAAGITCVAFPNENTAAHDFAGAQAVVAALDLDQMLALLS